MSRLSRITIFPIKSLEGVPLTEVTVLPSGALAGDRQYRIVDAAGEVVNAKREPRLLALQTEVLDAGRGLRLQGEEGWSEPFLWREDPDLLPLAEWLSAYLGQPVTLERNDEVGFPDDTDAAGPTLLSHGTLEELARWFPELTVDEVRRRLRANLEIDAAEPFWEEALLREPGGRFQLGSLSWVAVRICQRCSVPTRDSRSGAMMRGFQRRFVDQRQRTLPRWSPKGAFDHFYRVAINTRLVAGCLGGRLQLGEVLQGLPDHCPTAAERLDEQPEE